VKEALKRKRLIYAVLITVAAVVLIVLSLRRSSDDTAFYVIMAIVCMIVAWVRALRLGGVERFSKQASHPELASARLQQTWEQGKRTRHSRMDDAYIITIVWGQNYVIALEDVIWAECLRDGRGRGNGGWHIETYDKMGKAQRVAVEGKDLFAVSTHMVKNHILIMPKPEGDLRWIWENPNEFQAYINRSRGRGGQNTFQRKEKSSTESNRIYTMHTTKLLFENEPVQVSSAEEVYTEIQGLHEDLHPHLALSASIPVEGVHAIQIAHINRGGTRLGGIEFYIVEARVEAQEESGTELYRTSIASYAEIQEIVTGFVERQSAPDLAEWVYIPEWWG